jgi:hypothetical protein
MLSSEHLQATLRLTMLIVMMIGESIGDAILLVTQDPLHQQLVKSSPSNMII